MAASEQIRPMVVEDAMHRGVITCRTETSALTVARIMAAHRIHSVLVVDDDGTCTGVVSDSELEEALLSGSPASVRASDVAAAPVVVDRGDTLDRALALMQERGTTHLVVSEARRPRAIGVLSVLDVAEAFSNGDAA